MSIRTKVFRNMYQDSVSLMQISARISALPDIEQASVAMGTETNLAQLRDANLDDGVKAGPNDLVIAVRGGDTACDAALTLAEEALSAKPQESGGDGIRPPPLVSLEMAAEQEKASNLALISVPGDYAAAEATKALHLGMSVMLFSDNVSLEHEREIKTLARDKNLLVMGPDCGTAIINGMPLGFANVVRRGAIGVVAASGTGLQEVTSRIDQLGAGISQALGTGGHDLHEAIGGISMLYGLDALAQDPDTKVIVLISKPPAPAVAEKILTRARAAGKPVVVNFLGAKASEMNVFGITPAHTLADAAGYAVALLAGTALPESVAAVAAPDAKRLDEYSRTMPPIRRFVRGVFAGGTFCYESQLLLRERGFEASSNTPVAQNKKLDDIWHSFAHTLVDMGDDDFTRGRPHPMIDPTLRNQRVLAELNDAQTAVVLFDLVLGYGASMDPATELLALIEHARLQAAGRDLPVLISHVCGTQADPQVRSRQVDILREARVLVAGCNAQAALWASHIAQIQAQK
ncbi:MULTISPECIES: acyl-CoA synthetase FdrA [Burkholderiaceae]|nr:MULTISPECIES: acyl-CoA synthetase FdrA [Burkholderiaceae]AME25146.1 hypothetical protein AXG89_05380 [Burkholderia sp. PAMC 26561]